MGSDVLNSLLTSQPLADTWDGWHVTVPNADFDFVSSLQRSLACEHLDDDDSLPDNHPLFSLSPFSSRESTPSPPSQPPPSTLLDLNYFDPQPDTETSSTPPKPKGHKKRGQKSSHAARNKQRDAARNASYGQLRHGVRDRIQERYINHAQAIESAMDIESADITSTAYTAKDDGVRPQKLHGLEELIGEKAKRRLKLVKWNGENSIPITDSKRRLVVVLAGHPTDSNWPALQAQAARALEEGRQRFRVPKNKRIHRRGAFPALTTGVSHGGGQTQPGNLKHDGAMGEVVEELNAMDVFRRLAGFAASAMASWVPLMYGYYAEKLGELHLKNPSLRRIWNTGIFSAASYNFGPRTCCFRHRDFANLPFGWCAVTALGFFDYTKGGHLILWDLGLVIEFPPGSTILLPSAIVAHSNVAISKHERRYSFAQYSAGGLFRWVDNKHQKAVDYLASLTEEELAEVEAKNQKRWKLGLSFFPVLKKGQEL